MLISPFLQANFIVENCTGRTCESLAVEMNLQILFNIAFGAGLTIAGWFFRQLWDAAERLRNDLSNLEKVLPVIYVRREEFSETMREIKEMFNKINDKLDRKIDK